MIVTEFHNGQGLGNQLWTYAVLRSLAYKKLIAFGVQSPERFKGARIFNLDFGERFDKGVVPCEYIREETLYETSFGLDISGPDSRLVNINDGTKFEGHCQSLSYLVEDISLLRAWIAVKPELLNAALGRNNCVVHVRGGDYLTTHSCLPKSYYLNAMEQMRKRLPNIEFVAVTDDVKYCKNVLPGIPIVGSAASGSLNESKANHHGGGDVFEDFQILYNAENIILSASTFSFWPAYLNPRNPLVIAPKYWFGHSKSNGWWSPKDSIIKYWQYLDADGFIFDGNKCIQAAKVIEGKSSPPKLNFTQKLKMKVKRQLGYLL
jgi:hypothetical protein